MSSPFRGIAIGLALSLPLWVLIYVAFMSLGG